MKRLLTITILLLYSTITKAYDFEVDGIYYNIISLSDLTVAVTSGGDEYSGEVIIPEKVVYKSKTLTVTEISSHAFFDCTNLSSISIPNSVEIIESYSFSGCSSLKYVRIEDGTDTLSLGYSRDGTPSWGGTATKGKGLFYDCPLETLYLGRNISFKSSYTLGYTPFDGENCLSLKSVTIGSCVTKIENETFKDCCALKELRIEDGERTLLLGYNGELSYRYNGQGYLIFVQATSLFNDCPLETLYLGRNISYDAILSDYGSYSPFERKLTSVTIGSCVTKINNYLFHFCNFSSIEIPNSVTTIGELAFFNCTGLTSIEIPNSVTSIGAHAFSGCTGLTSITIPNSVTSIGDYAFSDCTGLTSIEISNSVTTIGEDAFKGCTGLKEVHISDLTNWCNINFKYEKSNPLYYAENLYLNGKIVTDLIIPSDVTVIKSNAFCNCSNLSSITIHNSVTSIGSSFEGCTGLKCIYLLGETPPSINSYNFTASQYINMVLYVPIGSLATYQNADIWKEFWDIQEFDVTGIGDINECNIKMEFTSHGVSFSNAKDANVTVYTINGILVKRIDNYRGEEIRLNSGAYIVRVGDKTIKVKL